MEKVYIISRYRAKNERRIEFHKEVARYFCRKIIDEGNVPVAPHIYYTQFLDDYYPDDRQIGVELAIQDLRSSDKFLLVMIDGVISEGMANELEEVSRLGLPGNIVCMTMQEIKNAMKVVR